MTLTFEYETTIQTSKNAFGTFLLCSVNAGGILPTQDLTIADMKIIHNRIHMYPIIETIHACLVTNIFIMPQPNNDIATNTITIYPIENILKPSHSR